MKKIMKPLILFSIGGTGPEDPEILRLNVLA